MIIIHLHPPNAGTPGFIEEILLDLKGSANSNALLLEDFNIPDSLN